MTIEYRFKHFAAATMVLALASTAQATLFDRGNGMIYDDHSNITWLADMNYAQTSGHAGTGVQANGSMTWNAAMSWASGLTYGGYSDWRLPTVNPVDPTCTPGYGPSYGINCTGGELSHLFVADFGIQPGQSVFNAVGDSPQQLANLGLFRNIQPSVYWTATPVDGGPGPVWIFASGEGFQSFMGTDNAWFATAVRPGDVLPAVTPVSGS